MNEIENRKLRIGVIGCGAIAQRRHLPEYKSRQEVELIAVVDLKPDRARKVAKEFDVQQHTARYQDLFALSLDGVSICTPTSFHARLSMEFLKRNVHVLCEKPMAGSYADAQAMVKAGSNTAQLMIAHNQRFDPAHVMAKQIFQEGRLGKPLGFSTIFAHSGPENWSIEGKQCHFFRKKEAIWGALADLGVHKIDLLRWLLNDDFAQVTAMVDRVQKKNCTVEDISFCVLKTRGGVLGQLFAGWVHNPGCTDSTVIYCDKGILRLKHDPLYPVIVEPVHGSVFRVPAEKLKSKRSGVIDAFVNAIRQGTPVPIPGANVLGSLATVVACIKSAQTGKTVQVLGK